MQTTSEYYRKWYDGIAPKKPENLITQLKVQGLWYPPDVCPTVERSLCSTIKQMVSTSRAKGIETGAPVCRALHANSIAAGKINQGTKDSVTIDTTTCPQNYIPIGTLHTHPPYEQISGIPDHYPSATDLQSAIYTGTHTNCVISEKSGEGECYTLRASKAVHDAYSIAHKITLDLEYYNKVSPETKDTITTFYTDFGCPLDCS